MQLSCAFTLFNALRTIMKRIQTIRLLSVTGFKTPNIKKYLYEMD